MQDGPQAPAKRSRLELDLFLGLWNTHPLSLNFLMFFFFLSFYSEKVIIIWWQESQIWTTTKGNSIVAQSKANLSTVTHSELFTRV